MRRATFSFAYLLFLAAVVCSCGVRTTTRAISTAAGDGPLYQRTLVERCLLKRHVLASSSPGSDVRPYIRRKTLTGGITIISGPIKGLPGPPIDAGNILFFSSSSAASQEQRSLADIFLFHKGEPDSVRVLFPPPPTMKAAARVQRLTRNVLIFWQWPRQHPTDSDRVVNACLAKSLR